MAEELHLRRQEPIHAQSVVDTSTEQIIVKPDAVDIDRLIPQQLMLDTKARIDLSSVAAVRLEKRFAGDESQTRRQAVEVRLLDRHTVRKTELVAFKTIVGQLCLRLDEPLPRKFELMPQLRRKTESLVAVIAGDWHTIEHARVKC